MNQDEFYVFCTDKEKLNQYIQERSKGIHLIQDIESVTVFKMQENTNYGADVYYTDEKGVKHYIVIYSSYQIMGMRCTPRPQFNY